MLATAPPTSTSSVLTCISGLSGASYGAEIPVKSTQAHTQSPPSERAVSEAVGRTFDLAGACLLVEALGIPALDDRQGGVDEHLDERDGGVVGCVEVPGEEPVGEVGRDEGGDGERACEREEKRDFGDAADLRAAFADSRYGFEGEGEVRVGMGMRMGMGGHAVKGRTNVLDATGLVEAQVLRRRATASARTSTARGDGGGTEGRGLTLLRPKRMLSPSRRYACSPLCRRCCSSALAIVDCPGQPRLQQRPLTRLWGS